MSPLWWSHLSSVEHVYWIIAVAATTVLAIQLVIACISGAEMGFHVGSMGSDLGSHGGDAGHGHDLAEPHFQLLTIRTVVSFFAIFGWSGLAFYHQGLSTLMVTILSFSCGLVMMVITAAAFYGLSRLQCSGNVDYSAAKGQKAQVYLRIPPVGTGFGQVKLALQGSMVYMDAYSTESKEIPTGDFVTIKEVSSSKAVVERA